MSGYCMRVCVGMAFLWCQVKNMRSKYECLYTHQHTSTHTHVQSVRQKIVHNGRNLCVMQYYILLENRVRSQAHQVKYNYIRNTRTHICTDRRTEQEIQRTHRSHQKYVIERTNEQNIMKQKNIWLEEVKKGCTKYTHTHICKQARTHLHILLYIFNV